MMRQLKETVCGKKEKVMGWACVISPRKTDVEHLCLKAFWSRESKLVRKCAILQVLEKYKPMSPYSVP